MTICQLFSRHRHSSNCCVRTLYSSKQNAFTVVLSKMLVKKHRTYLFRQLNNRFWQCNSGLSRHIHGTCTKSNIIGLQTFWIVLTQSNAGCKTWHTAWPWNPTQYLVVLDPRSSSTISVECSSAWFIEDK